MPVCKRGRHKVQIILYNERIHPAVLRKSKYIYTATKATIKNLFRHLKAGRGLWRAFKMTSKKRKSVQI